MFAGVAVYHAKRSADADNLALAETRKAAADARSGAETAANRFDQQMAKQQELVESTAKTANAMDRAATAQHGAASAMRESAEAAQQTLTHAMQEARAQAARAKEQLGLQDQTMQFTAETAHAMKDSARAAKRNADAIPLLERAYVHSEVTGEYIASALHGALTPTSGFSAEPTVSLRFKNFGKTPATLVHGEVFFSFSDGTPRGGQTTQWPIEYQQVLGASEATVPFDWDLGFDLANHEAQAVNSGAATLRLWGWLTYLDVFDHEQQCDIGWAYNVALKRMTPDTPKREKNRRDLKK